MHHRVDAAIHGIDRLCKTDVGCALLPSSFDLSLSAIYGPVENPSLIDNLCQLFYFADSNASNRWFS